MATLPIIKSNNKRKNLVDTTPSPKTRLVTPIDAAMPDSQKVATTRTDS